MSLKQRLLTFVAILLLVVIAALSGLAYWKMRVSILDGVSREIEATVKGNREVLSRWLLQRQDAMEATAARINGVSEPIPFLIAGKDAGKFDQTFVGDVDKKMVYNLAEKKPAEGYDPSARPWFKQARDLNAVVVTPPYLSASTKKLGITVARRVEGSSPLAVVGGDIALEEIINLVKGITLRGDGYVFLATRDGKIVAHSQPESGLKPVSEVVAGFDPALLQSASQQFILNELELGGEAKYVVVSPINGVDWVLCAVVDKATILSPLRALVWVLVFAGLLVGAMGVLLANLVLSRLLQSLFSLRDALSRIAEGNADLTQRLPVDKQDEIGQMAGAFNRFIASLQSMFIEVRQGTQALNVAIDSLNGVTRSMAVQSERQAESLSATAATVEEITVSINHIADNARAAEDMAGRTGETSRQSAAAVGTLAQEIGQMSKQVGSLATTLASLGDRSREMNAIIGVIREIADQTNLLALNAAIEAARAGETGRGFAVVADEVRKLAERTARATVDIGQLIDSTHGDIRSALSSMQSTQQSVELGQRSSQQVAQEISAIQRDVEQMVASVRDIASSTHEQSVATSDMARSAEQVNRMTLETDQEVQSATRTVAELSKLSGSLHDLVARFRL